LDLLDYLQDAHWLARDRVASVEPDQWSRPTNCTDRDVGHVVLHLLQGFEFYDALLTDSWTAEGTQARVYAMTTTPQTAVSMFDEVSQRLLARFASTDLVRPVEYPGLAFDAATLVRFSILECCVHSWDLAQALGVDGTFNEELAQLGYDGLAPCIDQLRSRSLFKLLRTDESSVLNGQTRPLLLCGRAP
jgi:uncharacterized protein (TIGR03086 family)